MTGGAESPGPPDNPDPAGRQLGEFLEEGLQARPWHVKYTPLWDKHQAQSTLYHPLVGGRGEEREGK